MQHTDSDREAWRQVRKQISEHEARVAELHMDLQSEKTAVAAEEQRHKLVQQAIKAQQNLKISAETNLRKQHRAYKDLQKASASASAETSRLVQQLDFLKQEQAQLQAACDDKMREYSTHIEEQQGCLQTFCTHCENAATAAEC
ncbi:hypothetical protein WJX72_001984 [[Myrmecia] bisecta]|uniref:Uncharacterized protein n=1 Tax=[Myrmecia] bisecta TaxID=41462 RepID=A0AAW1R4P1_9CHLO